MSTMSLFFKNNKKIRENVPYAATKSLCGEDGSPLIWEIKPVSAKENDVIQNSCMKEIPVPGKPNQYRQKLDATLYARKLLAASVVFPDLLDADLQDSYGVKKPEDLVQELVDDSGEWNAFLQFVNQINGFVPISDEVEEAKN